MFFVLSKILTFLIMPVSMIVGCFILSFIIKKKKVLFRSLGIGLLFFFTNPFFSGLAMKWWEVPPTEFKDIKKPYAFAVVLCGITDPTQEPRDRVHFNGNVDRITHTLQLYKQGLVKKILISGGSGFLLDQDVSESKNLYDFCLIAGVKKRDIILENESRNTRENAAFSAKKIKEMKLKGRFLLVTSGFHMRRSQACFKKESLNFDVFSTDVSSGKQEYTPDSIILPNPGSLDVWSTLIREWVGMIAYKLMGYI
ncbi:MAG: YdcF family protein [Cyclobacteriaceae bacterium]